MPAYKIVNCISYCLLNKEFYFLKNCIRIFGAIFIGVKACKKGRLVRSWPGFQPCDCNLPGFSYF